MCPENLNSVETSFIIVFDLFLAKAEVVCVQMARDGGAGYEGIAALAAAATQCVVYAEKVGARVGGGDRAQAVGPRLHERA